MDGDLLCVGDYNQIDSIKVVLENGGPSSKWMSVFPSDGLIQIKIATKHDLKNYIIFNNRKYQVYKNKLKDRTNK